MSERGLEDAIHDIAHQILETIQEVVEVDERTLGFHVRVLGEMATGASLQKYNKIKITGKKRVTVFLPLMPHRFPLFRLQL